VQHALGRTDDLRSPDERTFSARESGVCVRVRVCFCKQGRELIRSELEGLQSNVTNTNTHTHTHIHTHTQ